MMTAIRVICNIVEIIRNIPLVKQGKKVCILVYRKRLPSGEFDIVIEYSIIKPSRTRPESKHITQ
jgi:hypothetical protein